MKIKVVLNNWINEFSIYDYEQLLLNLAQLIKL